MSKRRRSRMAIAVQPSVDRAAAAVLLPEPGSASMLGTGALLAVGLARRRGAI